MASLIIKNLSASNINKAAEMVERVEGRAKTRTLDLDAAEIKGLCQKARQLHKATGLPVIVELDGGAVPSGYKYPAETTHFEVFYGPESDGFVMAACRGTARKVRRGGGPLRIVEIRGAVKDYETGAEAVRRLKLEKALAKCECYAIRKDGDCIRAAF
jgi:hypothetical protein